MTWLDSLLLIHLQEIKLKFCSSK